MVQTRMTARKAIICSVLLCAGFTLSRQAAAQVPNFQWILSGHALEYVDALYHPITGPFFNNSHTFVATLTKLPTGDGWSTASVIRYRTFTAYAPCSGCSSLTDAINAGTIDPNATPVLMYDIEGWKQTPTSEQADPITAMQNFVNAVRTAFPPSLYPNVKTILAPALSLFTRSGKLPCDTTQFTTWQCYLNFNVPSAARNSDYFEIQSQSLEFNPNVSNDFETFVQQASAQAHTANPNVIVLAGVSTNPTGGTPSAPMLYTRMTNVQSSVSGFWLNIPAGPPSCPLCGPLRPDIAVQLLEQLEAKHTLYLHSGGGMDTNSPATSTNNMAFDLTAAGATRTWVSSASYTPGTSIPAGDYTFQWYTDGPSNSRTPSAGLALTVGYCTAGCPASSQVPIVSNWKQTVVGGANTGQYGGATAQITTAAATILPCGGPWYLYVTVNVNAPASSGLDLLYDSGPQGSGDHSTNFPANLAIPTPVASPGGDFSLSITPSSQTVAPGGSTSYVANIGGFSGLIDLGISGLPSGAAGSFSPNPAASSSTLAVTATTSTPGGSSTLTFTGNSGCISHNAQATLVVVPRPPALVQSGALITGGSGTITVTLRGGSQAGNLLVTTLTAGNSTFSGPSGWVRAAAITTSTQRAEVWYYPNNPGGVTSATFTSGATFARGEMTEWSGLSRSSPLDVTGSSSIASAAGASVSTSVPTTGSNELAITAFAEDLGSPATTTFTPGAGWTNLVNTASRNVRDHAIFDYELGVSGVVSETESGGHSGKWAGLIVTFKP